MKAQTIEQVEFFSEAELESLEFVPEELEAIEAEQVPDLDSISFEEVAKDLEAFFEGDTEEAKLEMNRLPNELVFNTLKRLGLNSLRRMAQTNHRFRLLALTVISQRQNQIDGIRNQISTLTAQRNALMPGNPARSQLNRRIRSLHSQINRLEQGF
ncbi:MAG: hypothetical protein KME22_00290 [Hassallia sp. WJT32-NPBG1]|jgi:hypothetical protein|nr:hypothetical protein [Hassallia sp. WJT32-NPBG1]